MKLILGWLKSFSRGCFYVLNGLVSLLFLFLGLANLGGWLNANQSTQFGLYFIFVGLLVFEPMKKIRFLKSALSIKPKYKFLVAITPLLFMFSWHFYNTDFTARSERFNQGREDNFEAPSLPSSENRPSSSTPLLTEKEKAANHIISVIRRSGNSFNVGGFCLSQERKTPVTFEECLVLAAAVIKNRM